MTTAMMNVQTATRWQTATNQMPRVTFPLADCSLRTRVSYDADFVLSTVRQRYGLFAYRPEDCRVGDVATCPSCPEVLLQKAALYAACVPLCAAVSYQTVNQLIQLNLLLQLSNCKRASSKFVASLLHQCTTAAKID